MSGVVLPLSQYAFMAWRLVKQRDNFTFTFTGNNCGRLWLHPDVCVRARVCEGKSPLKHI